MTVPNYGSEPTRDEMTDRIESLQAQAAVDRSVIAHLETEGVIHREKIAHLEYALITARRIGAAIGILMARHQITSKQAFERLSAASQARQQKLRQVAEDVILTGTLD